LLGAAVLAVYWRALHCGFVGFDDDDYVVQNTDIQQGLNWQSIHWAFSTLHSANWHPLTWISHIIDVRLFGLKPAGHHLTNVLLHLASSVLLFLLLERATGAMGCSAFVAALFALHPLRVESVVWVSERKDVLSTFFWMLAVLAYVRYAENLRFQISNFKFQISNFTGFYALSIVFFALGLMAKPMLVTLPFVLLLLDYWPLGRFNLGWRLLLEKIPFFVLAAGSSVVTYMVQNHFLVVASLAKLPLSVRLGNIPCAYVRYLAKNFWPAGLAAYYPLRQPEWWPVCGAVGLLGLITAAALWRWRERPFLAVGWFWFLGMLVPAIGLVQVGGQAMADRYSYLPSVGLWIMVAWGAREWVAGRPLWREAAALAGGLAVIACMVLTPRQERYWDNGLTLFTHAADVTGENYQAHYNLGCYAMSQGDYPHAIAEFQRALRAEPDTNSWVGHSNGRNNLGYAYLRQGDISNAVAQFEKALAIRPVFPEAYYNLGRAFLTNHQPDVAVDCFQRAVALDSSVAEIQFSLGETLLQLGRPAEARACLEKAIQIRPKHASAHYKLGNALVQLGRPAEAMAQYALALQIRGNYDEAANNLAWLLATCSNRSLRDGTRAVALARQASEHSHDANAVILGTLAAAYAETGDFPGAAATARRARQLALEQTNQVLAADLESQLRKYEEGLRP
jgi:Flp pilus assembly protein TadD/uncharacterized membrane protein